MSFFADDVSDAWAQESRRTSAVMTVHFHCPDARSVNNNPGVCVRRALYSLSISTELQTRIGLEQFFEIFLLSPNHAGEGRFEISRRARSGWRERQREFDVTFYYFQKCFDSIVQLRFQSCIVVAITPWLYANYIIKLVDIPIGYFISEKIENEKCTSGMLA